MNNDGSGVTAVPLMAGAVKLEKGEKAMKMHPDRVSNLLNSRDVKHLLLFRSRL
jgi:hypothetical protein